jgi:hypothetical protein
MGRGRHPVLQLWLVAAAVLAVSVAPAVRMDGSGIGLTSSRELAPVNLGDGFLTLSRVQNVTGAVYFDTFCADQVPFEACATPIGLTYFSPNRLVVLTQEVWSDTHYIEPNANAIVEFDPSTLQNVSYLHLGCEPGIPFYPGVGSTVWVPCSNDLWSPSGTLLGYDALSGAIVANLTYPIWSYAMTYDPRSSVVYSYGWNSSGPGPNVAEFNTSSPAPTELSIRGLESGGVQIGGTPPFAFDSVTGEILYGSNQNELLEYNISTGQSAPVVGLSSVAYALAVDAAANEILVSTNDPSTVVVLNAATYSVESQFTVPNCFNGLCAEPNDVNQILVDPTHGDAYLVSTIATLALNLSTQSLVGTVVGYGDGAQVTAAYSPSSDRIFGTYNVAGLNSPGFAVLLHHGSEVILTSVLWLPIPLGSLVAAASVGAVCAVFRLRGAPVHHREPPPEHETYLTWD